MPRPLTHRTPAPLLPMAPIPPPPMAHTPATRPTQASQVTPVAHLEDPHPLATLAAPLLAILPPQDMARHLATILPSREAIKDTATRAHLGEDIILRGTWDRQVDLEVILLRDLEVLPALVAPLEDQEAIPRMTPAMDPRLAKEGHLHLGLLHHKMTRKKLKIMIHQTDRIFYFVTIRSSPVS